MVTAQGGSSLLRHKVGLSGKPIATTLDPQSSSCKEGSALRSQCCGCCLTGACREVPAAVGVAAQSWQGLLPGLNTNTYADA